MIKMIKNEIRILDDKVAEVVLGGVGGAIAIVSTSKLDIVRQHYWLLVNGYMATFITAKGKRKLVYYHRLVMGLYEKLMPGIQVDHSNHVKLDVRDINLRKVTAKQNRDNDLDRLVNLDDVPFLVTYAHHEGVEISKVLKEKYGQSNPVLTIGKILELIKQNAERVYHTGYPYQMLMA
ncbi:hypothetical protein GE107_21490 [Cohnella sp. CFH 77786]|uniref:hypothetical protein n=1 Tax=Cohnella sp. CFH 77786 TaxID=2662265 RepID=UPI001C60D4E2|nr:hypothetical protein [Cohnella sp. CFH 77786]MBW5448624.1 hypothetical protein [Cohnella sp. CFH 77786]